MDRKPRKKAKSKSKEVKQEQGKTQPWVEGGPFKGVKYKGNQESENVNKIGVI
jgi:hypothetical protein